jgi:hypothetical protein
MSGQSIRAIAQQFLTIPPIPGLPTVLREWDDQMMLVAQGGLIPLQTLAALHIARERDKRVSVPAVSGWVMVDYTLQLHLCILLEGSGNDIADAADGLIETIKNRLRSDPLMGRPPLTVFQSAQEAGRLIDVRRGDVVWMEAGSATGTPVQWVLIEWVASEMLTA